MASSFGKTWWGQQWLQSLNDIDFSNRLPRGATYARKGAVLSIVYQGNVINAKVQGSRRTPYKISISLPKFSEKDIDSLIGLIVKQPVVLSKMLNRQLDRSLSEMSDKVGLPLFPKRWSDWDMQCSCPDWAVPCKHIAAVIYQLSKEIDNNPFLIFSLHGVDLLAELERRNVATISQQMLEVERLDSVYGDSQLNLQLSMGSMPDYASLPELTTALSDLLPASPAFCLQGDFKEAYKRNLNRAVKNAKKVLEGRMRLDGDIIAHVRGKEVSEGGNYQSLLDIDPSDLHNQDASTLAWRGLILCALQLVAHGCIVPQIYSEEVQKTVRKKVTTYNLYRIVWQPVMIDKATASVVSCLGQPVQMLNRIITQLVAMLSSVKGGNIFEDLFFSSFVYAFDAIGETSAPGGIRSWLDRYYIQNKYSLTFKIEEDEEDFLVDVWVDGRPLSDIMSSEDSGTDSLSILQQLSVLCDIIDGLSEYINCKGTQSIRYSRRTFVPFLFNVVPAVSLLGVSVVMPRSLQNLIRPQMTVSLSAKSSDGVSHISLSDMLTFDWRVAVGDEMLTPAEFEKLLGRASGLLRFKERYIYLDEDALQKLRHALDAPPRLKPGEMLQAAFCGDYRGAPIEMTDELREMIRQYSTDVEIPLPHALEAQLRPYQMRGYSWMYRNIKLGFGSIIADDMGLGKTLQVITLLQKLKEEGGMHHKSKALVVVPTGLLNNWQSEVSRFAPEIKTAIYHGSHRSLTDAACKDADILLTTYGVVRMDSAKLKKKDWCVVVVDEAQNIKNSDTAQSKAIRSLAASNSIAMSGTPVENRLSEYWSIMDFVNPGYLGTLKDFKAQYALPIQQDGNQRVAERFRKITAPFMMRRLKTDKSIISDLPDKIVRNELASLSPEQAALYQETLASCMAVIEDIEGEDAQSLFKRQGLVLQMILALKQICNHPAQYLKDGHTEVSLSGKAVMLVDMLRSIVDAGEKVLVFTQFKEMGAILSGIIAQELGVTPMFYHGGCSLKQREAMVSRFQNNPADRIFLLSLKAAGTGLNLTAATHVIHYDLWWNPAVEAQATDRAYRIGQHKNVQVHRFITQNTFEERIDAMIQDKRHLADMTVATGESWIGQLSNKELREVLTLGGSQ